MYLPPSVFCIGFFFFFLILCVLLFCILHCLHFFFYNQVIYRFNVVFGCFSVFQLAFFPCICITAFCAFCILHILYLKFKCFLFSDLYCLYFFLLNWFSLSLYFLNQCTSRTTLYMFFKQLFQLPKCSFQNHQNCLIHEDLCTYIRAYLVLKKYMCVKANGVFPIF